MEKAIQIFTTKALLTLYFLWKQKLSITREEISDNLVIIYIKKRKKKG